MLDARRCHYHAGKSASRGTRVAAQVRHARRGATILNIHRTGVLSTLQRHIDIHISYIFMSAWLPGYLNSTSFSRRVSSFGRPRRLYNDHDGYIYNSWLRIPYILLSAPPARRHVRARARRHLDGNPPDGDRIKPSRAGAQIGVSSRGRGTSRRRAAAAHRRVVGAPHRPP